MTILSILDSSGDTKLTWQHDDPKSVADARKNITDLKAAGYSFFIADGTPADEVTAGAGELEFRRVDVEELVADTPAVPERTVAQIDAESQTVDKKKAGRPARQAVAVPRQQGG